MSCGYQDSCSELSRKIHTLDTTIRKHREWDHEKGVCRHEDEIADYERACLKSVYLCLTKCTRQRQWYPEPTPDDLPYFFLIAVCLVCPEC